MAEDRTVKVRLSRAISVGGTVTDELTMREPTLGHYRIFDALGLRADENGRFELTNVGSLAHTAVCELAGLTPAEAAQIPLGDVFKIMEAALGFFGVSLPTGLTVSQP